MINILERRVENKIKEDSEIAEAKRNAKAYIEKNYGGKDENFDPLSEFELRQRSIREQIKRVRNS